MPVTINGTTGVSLVAANGVPTVAIQDDAVTAAKFNDDASQLFGFRNKIINGAMEVDQRSGGSAVVPTNTQTYIIDRWFSVEDTDGAVAIQRSSVAPPGFINSILTTVTTADSSLSALQYMAIGHIVEGLNISDLSWGTASARSVTISFWVRSSVTGTFSGAINNNLSTRSYPFTYTINSANTWEYKTITIPGDTSGTWLTTNGIGLALIFSLGTGSTYSGNANAWASTNYIAVTGSTSLMDTLNATWQITGVQLEVGSVATPFEKRPYGLELSLCQRYYETGFFMGMEGYVDGTGRPVGTFVSYNTTKRVAGTMTLTNVSYSFASGIYVSDASVNGLNIVASSTTAGQISYTGTYNISAEL